MSARCKIHVAYDPTCPACQWGPKLEGQSELPATVCSARRPNEGNRRWREEAQKQARIVAVLEAFINAEMKMTAKDPRIKRLARLIAKASNS